MGRAAADEVESLMMTLNRPARDAMVRYRVHACTDVTGFAVMGHMLEMAQGADAAIELEAAAFELLDGARDLAAMGI
ncbi:AIR synthase-related protein, partial [Escherichia coli]|nr:AIR synthase-related protein [Escherichia coli]